MAKKPKKYSVDFKQEAVRRMTEATNVVGLAKQLGVRRKLLYQWRDRFEAEGRSGLERRRGRPPGSKSEVPPSPPDAVELRVAELERLLGRKQLEVDFLRRAFEHVKRKQDEKAGRRESRTDESDPKANRPDCICHISAC